LENHGVCCIFGAGEYYGEFPALPADCFVIAADGGFAALKRAGITPHVTVGDFDSLPEAPPENAVKLPRCKDVTDMFAALEIGMERGCAVFHLYGGAGGRLDHTLANIQLLCFAAEKGRRAFLHGEGFTVTAIANSGIAFPASAEGVVSVFAHGGEARGVSIRGLKYPLENAVLTSSFPLGVSNSFLGTESEISVEKGVLVIVYQNQQERAGIPHPG
jgi:thiamine pyrophosphokinase